MSFDMGGQKDYRDSYFEKADMYFGSGADVIIYCIDIQDSKRYEDSIVYFSKILEAYEKYELHPPVLVVFTKLDPDIGIPSGARKLLADEHSCLRFGPAGTVARQRSTNGSIADVHAVLQGGSLIAAEECMAAR